MQTHSLQPLPFSTTVVLTSTVMAGKTPMVMVKTKHTERAMTQIWDSTRVIRNRSEASLCITGLLGYVGSWSELIPVWRCQTLTRRVCSLHQSGSGPASSLLRLLQAKNTETSFTDDLYLSRKTHLNIMKDTKLFNHLELLKLLRQTSVVLKSHYCLDIDLKSKYLRYSQY